MTTIADSFVIVHQYVLPDGSIGASGKPDSKRLKAGGKIYATQSSFHPIDPPGSEETTIKHQEGLKRFGAGKGI